MLCELLGTPECMAASREAYPELAVRIACDSTLSKTLRDRILSNSSNLFRGAQPAANDIADFVLQVARG
jgi:predicted O-linked N-acetylglucosamine transferase (SPINDLY family)